MAQAAFSSKDKAYIIDDCATFWDSGTSTVYHLGAAYFDGSGGEPMGAGWYCSLLNSGEVWWRSDGYDITSWEKKGYWTADGNYHKYDKAHIHKGCGVAAFRQDSQMWECFTDSDFGVALLSQNDLAFQANRAAHAFYAGDDRQLYSADDGGYFEYDEWTNLFDLSFGHPFGPSNSEYNYAYENTGPDDDVKIWRVYNQAPSGAGFFWIDKGWDADGNVFLQFWCTVNFTDERAPIWHC